MKKMIKCLALAMVLACLSVSALAASILEDIYSDAPANPTQENVDEFLAAYQPEEGEKPAYGIVTMEPTQLTIDILKEIFEFVDINKQPPVRYFPEETQREIKEIIGQVDPDALYMPEFMSILPEQMQLDADVKVDVQMNIDYREGQLVVPVLGRETEEGVEWKALPADVVAENVIRFTVPKEELVKFAGDETLFALLALKPGSGQSGTEATGQPEEVFVPSVSASDIIYVEDEATYNKDGEALDCRIVIVAVTKPIEAELEKLTAHFTDPEQKPIRYFDEETVNETALILKDIDIDTLLPYEITQVMAIEYEEPYGDVMAKFVFPTPFTQEQKMVAIIGMPQEDETFFWMPLRAEKVDDFVEITFSSSVLPAMMEDAGILLVMSELIAE